MKMFFHYAKDLVWRFTPGSTFYAGLKQRELDMTLDAYVDADKDYAKLPDEVKQEDTGKLEENLARMDEIGRAAPRGNRHALLIGACTDIVYTGLLAYGAYDIVPDIGEFEGIIAVVLGLGVKVISYDAIRADFGEKLAKYRSGLDEY